MQNEFYSIAIDGPASSGKSTIAKKISELLDIEYIDTGAMYRALTWKVLKNNIDPKDKAQVINLLEKTNIDFKDGNIYLDKSIINNEIRLNEVSKNVSYIAVIPEVRKKMVELQQEMSKTNDIIMDGRDIGTVVLIDSKFKFFLTASIEERAKRRFNELEKKGNNTSSLKEVKDELIIRDEIDSNREADPLKMAEDATLIDTTDKSIEEVIDIIVSFVRRRQEIVL